ncbi:partial Carboxylesterase B, partial [Anaerolineae bacterium]
TLFIIVLITIGLSPVRSVAAQADVPRFESAPCPFVMPRDERIDCGYLIVAEDRSQPSDRTIKIGVAIVKSHSPKPQPDPLIVLNGGPGGRMIEYLPDALPMFEMLLATRDVILYDQRGAGWSQPALNCPEIEPLDRQDAAGAEVSIEQRVVAFEACGDRLQREGMHLSAYNTAENAADFNDLRVTLGYPQVNLFGVSYGTILGQAILRDYQTGIRTAVLDSMYPLDSFIFNDSPDGLTRYFETTFANCAADPICRMAYPDVQTVFYQLLDRFKRTPLALSVHHPINGETYSITLDDAHFVSGLVQTEPRQMPARLYDLRDGEYAAWQRAIERQIEAAYQSGFGGLSLGVKVSVLCSQRLAQVDLDQFDAAIAHYPINAGLRDSLATDEAVCARWPAHAIDARDARPVHSAVPTLMLIGEYDPGVSMDSARQIAATFETSYAYVIPNTGHYALGNSSACTQSILFAFLNDPQRAPDGNCLTQVRRTEFELRPAIARPPTWIMSVLLAAVLGVSAGRAAQTTWRFRKWRTWRISASMVGWLPSLAGAVAIGLLYAANLQESMLLRRAHLIESLLPLIAGVQAAFLLSPEDEPALEVSLACPRPFASIMLERLSVLFASQGSVALIGTMLIAASVGESAVIAVARWLAPLLFFAGLGVWLTLVSRQAVFSVGLIMLLWFGFNIVSESLVARWPALWPISVFLQPDHIDYALNRAFIALIGLGLLTWTAVTLNGDSERVLLGQRRSRDQRQTTDQTE